MFKGWVRSSLIDYPDHIATVLFAGGCDFRCPFCHNASLVLIPHQLPNLNTDDLLRFLAERQGLINGVVITGGEPTLQPELIPLLRQIRSCGMHVKLDTNGYHPDTLAMLLERDLVDYIAMDVKAPPAKYAQLAGLPHVNLTRIERSITLIQESPVRHEFRTTVVPQMLDEDDIAAIARWIAGAELYSLQQFYPQNTLARDLRTATPYAYESLASFAQTAATWVKKVIVRGAHSQS